MPTFFFFEKRHDVHSFRGSLRISRFSCSVYSNGSGELRYGCFHSRSSRMYSSSAKSALWGKEWVYGKEANDTRPQTYSALDPTSHLLVWPFAEIVPFWSSFPRPVRDRWPRFQCGQHVSSIQNVGWGSRKVLQCWFRVPVDSREPFEAIASRLPQLQCVVN